MDVADLRLLEAVADSGSFSAAAAELRMSQPSVSARVGAVERAVGATLFVRTSRGARLTPAGKRYLGYIRRATRLLADGARAAGAESPSVDLAIGIPASYAAALAPLLIEAAGQQGRAVTLRTGHSRHLRAELGDGLLDLAITAPGPLPVGLTSHHLIDTPIVTLGARGRTATHCWAVHAWASNGVDAVITELLGRGLARTGISVVSPASTALALAEHHGHLAVVPQLAARQQLAAGTLLPYEAGLPRLHTSLEWVEPVNRPTPSPLDQLTHAIEERLSRQPQ